MNLETRKLHLIERLARIDNEQLINRIEQLVNETVEDRYKREFGYGLPDAMVQLVREGEADIAAGRTYTTDEVKAYFKSR